MKNLNLIREILKKNKMKLKEIYKVNKIGIFGSYARNEQQEISDIDILVKFSEPIGWEFLDLKEFLETILNIKVDLVTINALKPQTKDKILKEVIYA